MYIFIRDQAYRKRIERFIHLNYADYSWLYLPTDKSQIDPDVAGEVLTDDLTFQPLNMTMHYIVEAEDERPNYHYKYQSFRAIIEAIKGRQLVERQTAARIVVVSSLLGGCGKTTFARQMAELLSTTRAVLLVDLLSPARSAENMLSEHLITSRHNRSFKLSDCVQQSGGLSSVGGFFSSRDLQGVAEQDVRQGMQNLLRSSPYRDVVIDAPALPHCPSIIEIGDVNYLIRDGTRVAEERAIISGMGIVVEAFKSIQTRTDGAVLRSLPEDGDLQNYQLALRNILSEDGIYEY